MKYLSAYRDAAAARRLAAHIARAAQQPWVIMEVCGGQTHSIVRYGIDQILPQGIELVHGPGCPVCVTPLATIDRAHAIALQPNVVFASFGDMLRVPGSHGDLLSCRARGADIRVVYSPLDAVQLARRTPDKHVVFFAIGFETTAPANAMAVHTAKRLGLENFSMLVAHVLVPPMLEALLQAPDNRVQGLLGPGHVCTVMGLADYDALAERHQIPIVVSGFEPVDLLEGILMVVRQLQAGQAHMANQYARSVRDAGNPGARRIMAEVFAPTAQTWRGIGRIANSGLRLTDAYRDYDAAQRFAVHTTAARESPKCISGLILRGQKKPLDCAAFGAECTPQQPLGATMVSAEGACAAYFAHGRKRGEDKHARQLG